MYNLEYSYLTGDPDFSRRIEAQLSAKTGGRKYVVSMARVQQEQPHGTEGSPQQTTPICASGSCGCSNQSGLTNTAPSCACQSSSACAIPTPATAATVASGSPITAVSAPASFPPLLFSTPSAYPPRDALRSFSLNGYSFSLPASLVGTKEDFHKVQVVWLGDEVEYALLTNCMLNYNRNTFHLYNPTSLRLTNELKSKSKQLARRYYLMEKAKNAEIVGILVGTLGVANYLDVIKYLKSLLLSSGKKSYLFVVGKLNEPKLSNFGEIDLFCLVACPLNTMFDSTGYYRDVVTPFELECALKGKEWNGEYATDFNQILPKSITEGGDPSPSLSSSAATVDDDGADSEDASDDFSHGMRFDPTTGKMRSALPSQLHAKGIKLSDAPEDEDEEGKEGQLITIDNQQLVRVAGGALVQLRTASDFFLTQRSFTGLLMKHEGEKDDAVAKIEPGLSGIARNYKTTALAPPEAEKSETTASPHKQTPEES